MPTDSPNLSKTLFAQALSSSLWSKHKPDRFDTWSVGIVLLCLALPALRTESGLEKFNEEFEAVDYNLGQWRAKAACGWLRPSDFALLDAGGGAGWGLAGELLRPRNIFLGDDGSVGFEGGDGGEPLRISAEAALKHRCGCGVFAGVGACRCAAVCGERVCVCARAWLNKGALQMGPGKCLHYVVAWNARAM